MGVEEEGAVPIKALVTFLFGGSRDWLAACAISAKDVLPPLRCLREGFVMLCSKERECELLGKSAKIGCWLWLWGSSYGTAVAGDVEDGEEEENAVVVGRVGGVVQL